MENLKALEFVKEFTGQILESENLYYIAEHSEDGILSEEFISLDVQPELAILKLSAEAFYLNKGKIFLTDESYDNLVKYLNLTESMIFDLIGIDQNRDHKFTTTSPSLSKHKINNFSELPDESKKGRSYYDTMKWDGSSIEILYNNGNLVNILSNSGISQLKKLKDHVPKKVNPRIKSILAEAVVDVKVYGDTSRGFANGLINSKHKQSEVNENLILRVFDIVMEDFDFNEKMTLMESLPNGNNFFVSELNKDNSLPTQIEGLVWYDTHFVDGIVRYYDDGSALIYKLYYNESGFGTTGEVRFQYTEKDTYSAKLIMEEPVKIEGVNIRQISTNGIRNLMKMRMGVGSIVEVIRSGSTIPKVKAVIEPSDDISFTCSCGTPMDLTSVFGNNVKCTNKDCTKRVHHFTWHFDRSHNFNYNRVAVKDAIIANPQGFANLFMIDRYNTDKVDTQNIIDSIDLLIHHIDTNNYQEYKNIIYKSFRGLTSLQVRVMEYHMYAIFNIYKLKLTNEELPNS